MSAGSLGHIGGHELIEVIARGGMGIVYRARQSDPAREVALKALPGAELMSEEARQRFKVEAQAMAKLDHPAIVPVYELGEEDGTPFFTMKLATGGTLSRRMGDYAGKWRKIAELMARIAEAVQFAHSRGVLHRDLKPGNILFDESGQALVSDFGLAKMIGTDSDLTKTLAMMGTPNYMAPEMAHKNGGVTTASDVWSLGVILYELLAGRVPFTGDNIPAVLRAVAEDEPTSLVGRLCETAQAERRLTETPYKATIPRDLAVITLKALQKDPARRYGTAQEFADDLRRWLHGEPIHARPVPLAERAWLWAKRKPSLAAALALLALTLVGSALLLVRSNEKLLLSNDDLRAVDAQRRGQIHRALLEKADAERQSMTPGRRERALALVSEALAHGVSTQARSVAASTLASLDASVEQQWPIGRIAYGQSPMAFTADLSMHIAVVPANQLRDKKWKEGALGLRRTNDGALLKQIPLTDRRTYFYAALSPDARWFCTTTGRSKLEIWDLDAEKLLAAIQSNTKPAAAFHPQDGTLIAALDGTLVRMKLPDLSRAVIATGISHTGRVYPSPDGGSVTLHRFGDSGEIESAWMEARSLVDGQVIARQDQPYGDAGWSTDSRSFAAFHYFTGYLMRHDITDASAKPLALLRTTGTGRRVVFRSGDRHLAWADNDGFIHLHDLWMDQPLLQLPGTAMNLEFSADGTRLAFNPNSEAAAIANILDAPILTQRKPHPEPRSVDRHLAVSPDGRWISTCDLFGLTLWRAADMQPVAHRLAQKPRDPFESLHFSADSRHLRFYCYTSKHVSWDIVEAADGTVALTGAGPDDPASPHYLQAASTNGQWQITVRADERSAFAHLWRDGEIVSKAHRTAEPGVTQRRNGLVSPDGRWWAIGCWNRDGSQTPGFLYVQSTEADDRRIMLSQDACHCFLACSPDGRWLLGGMEEDYVIWDSTTWKEVFRLPAALSDNLPGSAAFSPDGTLLALEVEHGKIRLLRPGTWEEILTLTPPQSVPIVRMAFSPDSQHLYTTGGQILHRWDVARLHAELTAMGIGW